MIMVDPISELQINLSHMKKIILVLMLAMATPLAYAQSDYLEQTAFYGENNEAMLKECHSIELKTREKINAVEKSILGENKNLINVKTKLDYETRSLREGQTISVPVCSISFLSFTPLLGFERVYLASRKNLGSAKKSRVACNDDAVQASFSENIVFAKAESYLRIFRGGHQCQVLAIRVIPMLY